MFIYRSNLFIDLCHLLTYPIHQTETKWSGGIKELFNNKKAHNSDKLLHI
jgi:hypothetical protein